MSASYYDRYTVDPEILKVGMRDIHFKKKILPSVCEITHLYIVRSSLRVACENIRFSSLFVAEDVPRETSSAAKSEEKRMFSQATLRGKTTDRLRPPKT